METSDSAVLGNRLSTFYLAALDLLEAHRLPFLVGGSFAYARYTGIDRETKDLDIFVRPEDVPRTLSAFEARPTGCSSPLSTTSGYSTHRSKFKYLSSRATHRPIAPEWWRGTAGTGRARRIRTRWTL